MSEKGRGPSCEAVVIEAAVAWVEGIGDHPNLWGDTKDFALIEAVKALTGMTYLWEEDRG